MIEINNTNFLKSLPNLPGCYIFKDKNKKPTYIGKAKILSIRINWYFSKNNKSSKIHKLIQNSAYLDFITTENEIEALILENNLIKKYKPKYNILLKDDKTYAWIKITSDEYPKIERVREKKNDGAKYFGPYPWGKTTIALLKTLREIFPFRDCNLQISSTKKFKKSRLCIYYDLNLCPGVCDNLIPRKEYLQNIKNIELFLQGKKSNVIKNLQKEMNKSAKNKEFEKATIIRDKIYQLQYALYKIKIDDKDIENTIQNKKNTKDLFKKIGIKYKNGRIECFDISNISGKYAVASMIVFIDGTPIKKDYRRFKIKTIDTPNDPYMMKEVIERRLTNQTKDTSFRSIPDLIVVDGGKTQLNAAFKIIDKINKNISIVGLAKRKEEIFKIGQRDPLVLDKFDPAHLLIRKIRDEAHRFAITYHRKIRDKDLI
ncbi:excinuclease ABC subunit UvrC [Patescibacteria group bacterium]|nr:excinuclease ABC subunit UvrC [Patescibacteria group bacterium]